MAETKKRGAVDKVARKQLEGLKTRVRKVEETQAKDHALLHSTTKMKKLLGLPGKKAAKKGGKKAAKKGGKKGGKKGSKK